MFELYIHDQHICNLCPTVEIGIRDALLCMAFLDNEPVRLRRLDDGVWFRWGNGVLLPLKRTPAVLESLWW